MCLSYQVLKYEYISECQYQCRLDASSKSTSIGETSLISSLTASAKFPFSFLVYSFYGSLVKTVFKYAVIFFSNQVMKSKDTSECLYQCKLDASSKNNLVRRKALPKGKLVLLSQQLVVPI